MNKLELSKEQGNKLLQMCNDLFPKYKHIEFDIADECLFDDSGLSIHWFEACVVHLPKKIAEGFNTVYPKEKHAFIIDMMMKKMLDYSNFKKVHPVDYLYEMYEKTLE
jgi:hypothetical protein